MAIMEVTRFKGGNPDELISAAKFGKARWEKAGAERAGFSRVHTGPHTGDWLFAVRFADWAAYGNAREAIAKDTEFQQRLTQVLNVTQMMERTLLTEVDL